MGINKMVEIKKKDLDRLFDMAEQGLYSDWCDFEKEDLLALRQKYYCEPIWYMVYPKRFFRSRKEAEAHIIEDKPKQWAYHPHKIEVLNQKEKDEMITDFKRFGWCAHYCYYCGYIDWGGSVGGHSYCVRCTLKFDKDRRFVDMPYGGALFGKEDPNYNPINDEIHQAEVKSEIDFKKKMRKTRIK